MTIDLGNKEAQARLEEWNSELYDAATQAELQSLIDAGDAKELLDRFHRTLEFGTGGLRGKLGAGTNRMNETVVSRATQGLANYVKAHKEKDGPLRAAVTHDCRHKSREFAEVTAAVFAANGFEVFISPELRPTPYLSYVVRTLNCHTGIVITASHNPKEYNGYKAYWDDGSQVVPPHDKGIIDEVDTIVNNTQVKRVDFQKAVAEGKIKILGPDMDEAYLNAVFTQRLDEKVIKEFAPKIVYTPLHGVGGTLTPKALEQWGFTDVICEPQQMIPNGDFPTAKSPNPEEGAALECAIALAKKEDADLVLATDPDADRLGIAVKHQGEFHLLTGNQVSCLMGAYLMDMVPKYRKLDKKIGIVTTVVTSPLLPRIVEARGGECPLTLTGFKWIAEVARRWEKTPGSPEFIMGTEESYGYTVGQYCRDKDGVVACCIVGEMAAHARKAGKTLVDQLHDLYNEFGVYVEWQRAITLPGIEGAEKIKSILSSIQNNPPSEVAGLKVVRRIDFKAGKVYHADGSTEPTDIPGSSVFLFDLENGSRAIARPSGTEPKIKFYFFQTDPSAKGTGAAEVANRYAKLAEEKASFEKAFFSAIGYEG